MSKHGALSIGILFQELKLFEQMNKNSNCLNDSKNLKFEQIYNKVSQRGLIESILESDNESTCRTDTIDFWQWFDVYHKNKAAELENRLKQEFGIKECSVKIERFQFWKLIWSLKGKNRRRKRGQRKGRPKENKKRKPRSKGRQLRRSERKRISRAPQWNLYLPTEGLEQFTKARLN